tara:strand:- start:124 stop:285 length:162 start_codon:yes stop_codon:yes gene_type:complete
MRLRLEEELKEAEGANEKAMRTPVFDKDEHREDEPKKSFPWLTEAINRCRKAT